MVCKNVKRTWTKAHVPVGVSVLTQRHTQEVEKETHRCSVSMGLVETTVRVFSVWSYCIFVWSLIRQQY